MEEKSDKKNTAYEEAVKEAGTAEDIMTGEESENAVASEINENMEELGFAEDIEGEGIEDEDIEDVEDEDIGPPEPVDPLEFVEAKSFEDLEELEFWEAYGDLLRMKDQEEAGKLKAEMDARLGAVLDDEIRKAFDEIVDEEYANRPKVPKAQFSKEFERMMQSVLYDDPEEEVEPEKKVSGLSSLLALFRPIRSRRAVVLVAVLMMLLVGTTAGGANPIIIWLHDSWMEQHGDYVEIENREDAAKITKESFQKYELAELPEGYELKNEQYDQEMGIYYITYVDGKDNVLFFKQGKKENGNLGNITANRKDIEEVEVDGFEGYYVRDSDIANLVLSDEEYMLVFTANMSKEQLIGLAGGLQAKE